MKNVVSLLIFSSLMFCIPQLSEARQGCCSHHAGVCGCQCCDGTSLSAKCAPYYPQCDSNSTMSCGIPPIPNIGCRVGECIDGHWEQICNSNPTLSCGIPPIPNMGCRIGECVDGRWEQICN